MGLLCSLYVSVLRIFLFLTKTGSKLSCSYTVAHEQAASPSTHSIILQYPDAQASTCPAALSDVRVLTTLTVGELQEEHAGH